MGNANVDVLGDTSYAPVSPPRYHSAKGAAVWGRVGAPEPQAQPAKAAPAKAQPLARVRAYEEAGLPGLTVVDGVCTVEGQDEPADADTLYEHVIGHLDRLDATLDARADELEARARHLEDLQADNFREQRRRALAAQEAGLSGALTRAADQTRRATEQLSAAMAEGLNSVIVTAPTPIQQLAHQVDRAMAPVTNATQALLGIKITRISSLKGPRRSVYADDLRGVEPSSAGGDNFHPRERDNVVEPEPAVRRFDDKNTETSVKRATGGPRGGSVRGSAATSARSSRAASPARQEAASVHGSSLQSSRAASPARAPSQPGSPAGSQRRLAVKA